MVVGADSIHAENCGGGVSVGWLPTACVRRSPSQPWSTMRIEMVRIPSRTLVRIVSQVSWRPTSALKILWRCLASHRRVWPTLSSVLQSKPRQFRLGVWPVRNWKLLRKTDSKCQHHPGAPACARVCIRLDLGIPLEHSGNFS